MSAGTPEQPTYIIPPPSGPNWKTPLLASLLILLIASNVYFYVQLEHVKNDSTTEVTKLRDDFNSALEKMRIDSSQAVQHSRHTAETLQAQLEQQRLAAERAVGQAKIDAQRRVDDLRTRVAEQQQKEQQAITEVKQTADTATTKINDVNTDLGSTKTKLEDTVANLKRATGELDSHSSLIATNASELKALRELGERNYVEFTIDKSKEAKRVADVMIGLKKADMKHNRFNIAITADDKTVEKKDRTINEPIQFYTSKAHQPYEIVVNNVTKNSISGYLSTPKVQAARAGS